MRILFHDRSPAFTVILAAAALACSGKSTPTITPPAPSTPPSSSSSSAPSKSQPASPAPQEPAEAEWSGARSGEERQAGLDRELDESLGEFDEMLRRKQDEAIEQQEAAAAAAARSGAARRGSNETPGASGTGGIPGSRSGAPPPDDVPDGADDDIVARQLREAAEDEQDPELRERLWDEYRKYKTGKGRVEADGEAEESDRSRDED